MFLVRTLVCVGVALTPLALSGAAMAQGMAQTLNMTCSQTQALVNSSGASVLATGPNVFDRYVKDMAYCPQAMVTKPGWVKTKDVAQCFVGYTCWDPSTDVGAR